MSTLGVAIKGARCNKFFFPKENATGPGRKNVNPFLLFAKEFLSAISQAKKY
jgi:hypothetical protein